MDLAPPSRTLRLALLCAVLLLVSCRTLSPTATTPDARRAQLRAISHFDFSGRVASVVGTQGVSAALDWQQRANDSTLQLRAPLGLGTLRIDYRDGQLQLQSGDGTEVRGALADDRLEQWLGFTPPLASLRYWLLGCSDPASTAEESFDPQQRLLQLKQDGWQINYQNYQRAAQLWLPQALSIERDGRKLKLVINRWQTS